MDVNEVLEQLEEPTQDHWVCTTRGLGQRSLEWWQQEDGGDGGGGGGHSDDGVVVSIMTMSSLLRMFNQHVADDMDSDGYSMVMW